MAQKISQMTEQSTASMTEAGTSDFLGGYTATGGNANRKFSLSGLANYFLNKFKMTLGGSSQTVKSAIDTLNSKAFVNCTRLDSGSVNDAVPTGATSTDRNNYYICVGQVTDMPSGVGVAYVTTLCVDGNNLMQILYSHVSGADVQYIRYRSFGTWSDWVKQPTRSEVDALNSKTTSNIDCTYNGVNFTLTITTYGNGVKCATVSSASSVTLPSVSTWVDIADTTLKLGTLSIITVAGDIIAFRTPIGTGKLQLQIPNAITSHWLAGTAVCIG